MKHLISALCLSFFLSGCGNQSTTPESTTDPKVGSVPTTTPTTSGKWTATQLQTQSEYCSEAGDPTYYDEATWLTFCNCTYQAAAVHWTFDVFFADFTTNYQTLSSEGSIKTCLTKAGMTYYMAK